MAKERKSREIVFKMDARVEEATRKLKHADIEVERLKGTVSATEQKIHQLEEAMNGMKVDAGVDVLTEKLRKFQKMSETALSEFKAMLVAANLNDIKGTNDQHFEELYKKIREGAMTANQAFQQLGVSIDNVLNRGSSKAGGILDKSSIEGIVTILDSVTRSLEEVFNELRRIKTEGVPVSGGGGGSGGIAEVFEQIRKAAEGLSESARSSIGSILNLVEALNKFAEVDAMRLVSVAQAFKNIADIGQGKFSDKSVNNIVYLAMKLSELSEGGLSGMRFDFTGLSNFKVSSTVNHLIDLLNTMNSGNLKHLRSLQNIDLSNLGNISVSKSTVENLIRLYRELGTEGVGAIGTGSGATAKMTSSMEKEEAVVASVNKELAEHGKSVDAAAKAEDDKRKIAELLAKALERETKASEGAVSASEKDATETDKSTDAYKKKLAAIEALELQVKKSANRALKAYGPDDGGVYSSFARIASELESLRTGGGTIAQLSAGLTDLKLKFAGAQLEAFKFDSELVQNAQAMKGASERIGEILRSFNSLSSASQAKIDPDKILNITNLTDKLSSVIGDPVKETAVIRELTEASIELESTITNLAKAEREENELHRLRASIINEEARLTRDANRLMMTPGGQSEKAYGDLRKYVSDLAALRASGAGIGEIKAKLGELQEKIADARKAAGDFITEYTQGDKAASDSTKALDSLIERFDKLSTASKGSVDDTVVVRLQQMIVDMKNASTPEDRIRKQEEFNNLLADTSKKIAELADKEKEEKAIVEQRAAIVSTMQQAQALANKLTIVPGGMDQAAYKDLIRYVEELSSLSTSGKGLSDLSREFTALKDKITDAKNAANTFIDDYMKGDKVIDDSEKALGKLEEKYNKLSTASKGMVDPAALANLRNMIDEMKAAATSDERLRKQAEFNNLLSETEKKVAELTAKQKEDAEISAKKIAITKAAQQAQAEANRLMLLLGGADQKAYRDLVALVDQLSRLSTSGKGLSDLTKEFQALSEKLALAKGEVKEFEKTVSSEERASAAAERYKELSEAFEKLGAASKSSIDPANLERMHELVEIMRAPDFIASPEEKAKAWIEFNDIAKRTGDTIDDLAGKEAKERSEALQRQTLLREANVLLGKVVDAEKKYANAKHDPSRSTYYENLTTQSAALQELIDKYNSGGITVEEFKQKLAELKTEITSTTNNLKNGAGASIGYFAKGLDTLKSRMAYMFGFAQIVMKTAREIKKMISTAVELDTALNQLQIVTRGSASDMDAYAKRVTQMAKETAQSTKDLIDATTVYARLGYTMDESASLAKYTAMLQGVGNIDASAAQDAMTAIIKAFGKNVDEIEDVMDKFVVVGNSFPISVSQLAEGMNNAGSMLAVAGNSMEESIALLTAANTTTQDISKASTGLRTIAARIRKTTTELDDLGEAINESKYEEMLQALAGKGVSLTTANGEYRSTYAVLKDIAGVWDQLGSMDQAAIIEALAGTRQQNVFSSLITQFKEAEDAMESMGDSSGKLTEAYDIYKESVQASVNEMKAAFDELSRSLVDTGLAKGAIGVLQKFLEGLNAIVSRLGSLGTVMAVLTSGNVLRLITKISALRKADVLAGNAARSIGAAFKAAGGPISAVIAALTIVVGIISAIKRSQQEAIDAAKRAAEEYRSAISGMEETAESQIQRIRELKERIASGDLSTTELIAAERELVSIKDDLVDTFGAEAKGLELLGSTADQAEESIRHLLETQTRQKASAFISSHEGDIEKAVEEMEKKRDFTGLLSMPEHTAQDIPADVEAAVRSVLSKYGIQMSQKTISGTTEFSFNVTGKTAAEMKEDALAASKELRGLGIDIDSYFKDSYGNTLGNYIFDKMIQRADQTLDDYAEMYHQAMSFMILDEDKFYDVYSSYKERMKTFSDAVNGEYDSIDEREKAVAKAAADMQDVINEIDLLTYTDEQRGVESYFRELVADYQESYDKAIATINKDRLRSSTSTELAGQIIEAYEEFKKQFGRDGVFDDQWFLQTDKAITLLEAYSDALEREAQEAKAAEIQRIHDIGSLSSLSDELEKTKKDLEAYKKAMEAGDKGDAAQEYADAYKKAIEDIEKGMSDSRAIQEAAKLIFSDDQLRAWGYDMEKVVQEMQSPMLKAIFGGDNAEYGRNFANYIKENQALFGEFARITDNGDGTFGFGFSSAEDLARVTGMTVESVNALLDCLDRYGVQVMMSDKEFGALSSYFYELKAQTNSTSEAVEQFVDMLAGQGHSEFEIADILGRIFGKPVESAEYLQMIHDAVEAAETVGDSANPKVDVDITGQKELEELDRLLHSIVQGSPYTINIATSLVTGADGKTDLERSLDVLHEQGFEYNPTTGIITDPNGNTDLARTRAWLEAGGYTIVPNTGMVIGENGKAEYERSRAWLEENGFTVDVDTEIVTDAEGKTDIERSIEMMQAKGFEIALDTYMVTDASGKTDFEHSVALLQAKGFHIDIATDMVTDANGKTDIERSIQLLQSKNFTVEADVDLVKDANGKTDFERSVAMLLAKGYVVDVDTNLVFDANNQMDLSRSVAWLNANNYTVDKDTGIVRDANGKTDFNRSVAMLRNTGFTVNVETGMVTDAHGKTDFERSIELLKAQNFEVDVKAGMVRDAKGLTDFERSVAWLQAQGFKVDLRSGMVTDAQGNTDFDRSVELLKAKNYEVDIATGMVKDAKGNTDFDRSVELLNTQGYTVDLDTYMVTDAQGNTNFERWIDLLNAKGYQVGVDATLVTDSSGKTDFERSVEMLEARGFTVDRETGLVKDANGKTDFDRSVAMLQSKGYVIDPNTYTVSTEDMERDFDLSVEMLRAKNYEVDIETGMVTDANGETDFDRSLELLQSKGYQVNIVTGVVTDAQGKTDFERTVAWLNAQGLEVDLETGVVTGADGKTDVEHSVDMMREKGLSVDVITRFKADQFKKDWLQFLADNNIEDETTVTAVLETAEQYGTSPDWRFPGAPDNPTWGDVVLATEQKTQKAADKLYSLWNWLLRGEAPQTTPSTPPQPTPTPPHTPAPTPAPTATPTPTPPPLPTLHPGQAMSLPGWTFVGNLTPEQQAAIEAYKASLESAEEETADAADSFESLGDAGEDASGWLEEVRAELEELGKGGSVDLLNRPVIDAYMLEERGWGPQEEGGVATVQSVGYTSSDGQRTLNFTPIIVDEHGNFQGILTPKELEHYAMGVLDGVHSDYLRLQIGAEFTGEDQIEKSNAAAKRVHDLQWDYYGDALTISYDEALKASQLYYENNQRYINLVKQIAESDYYNTPRVMGSALHARGWGDYFANADSAYSPDLVAWNEDETRAILCTPVITDPNNPNHILGILTPEEMTEYIEAVCDGADDVLNLAIGTMFTGEGAKDAAYEELNRLRALFSDNPWYLNKPPIDDEYTDYIAALEEGLIDIDSLDVNPTIGVNDLATATLTGIANLLYTISKYGKIAIKFTTPTDTTTKDTQGAAKAAGGLVKKKEDTLLNELGPELISENGEAYIANGGQPGFVRLSKDAIVFNAEETARILHGRKTTLGNARANGTRGSLITRLMNGGRTPAKAMVDAGYGGTQMQRCPYCREWIPYKHTGRCPNKKCQKYLINGMKPEDALVKGVKAGVNAVKTGAVNAYNWIIKNGASYQSADVPTGYDVTATDATGGGGGGAQSTSNPQKIDWISVKLNRLQRVISDLQKIASSAFKKLSTRLDATKKQITQVTGEIDVMKQAYSRYISEAEGVGLSADLAALVRDGTIDISEYDDETRQLISEYQEWYEKALDCQSAIEDLHQSLAQLYQENFNNVQADFERRLNQTAHAAEMINKNMTMAQTRGYLDYAGYYESLAENTSESVNTLQQELGELNRYFTEAMNSGEIEEGSEAWYGMKEAINGVEEALADANIQLVEYQRTIREINWNAFDYAQERMSQLVGEAEFLISLMSNDQLFEENGQFNGRGAATAGMHALNYDVYMAQADEYAKEIMKIQRELEKDPYDTALIERRETLLGLQQQSILSAESEKDAVRDLVSQGIQIELEALRDLIDAYKDSLDSAKDLYDYQKRIADQTSDIASMEKQLAAYQNDTSEENRARVQKLQKQLAEARTGLNEAEWDRSISDQKELLDEVYDEYEEFLNKRLDDVDKLMADIINGSNANADAIRNELREVGAEVGYTLTEGMRLTLDGKFANYDHMFEDVTGIHETLQQIYVNVALMAQAAGNVKAFASGGLVDYTGLAAVHGTRGKPELMLNASDTARFLEAASLMRSAPSPGAVGKGLAGYGSGGGMNIGSLNISIPIEHVQDYNDMIAQMQKDPKFDRLINAITLDRATGRSSLGKYGVRVG